MKTISLDLFGINELNDAAQKYAYNEWLQTKEYDEWGENYRTLQAFVDKLPIKVKEVYGAYETIHVDWRFTESVEIEQLSYLRLHKYIMNNYWNVLFKACYVRCMKNEEPIKHPYVQVRKAANGKFYNTFHSLMRPTRDCNLTGYFIDEAILDPMYKFLNNPENITFSELIQRCLNKWMSAVRMDYKQTVSMQAFIEEMEYEDTDFMENGVIYKG